MNFTVNVVGSAGCGKTMFLRRLNHQMFVPQWMPASGHQMIPITFNTSMGQITVNFADHCGRAMYTPFAIRRDPADAVIYTIDLTSRMSVKGVKTYRKLFRDMLGFELPSMTIATKVDIRDRKVTTLPDGCIEISSKNRDGINDAIQSLLRTLTNNSDLVLLH